MLYSSDLLLSVISQAVPIPTDPDDTLPLASLLLSFAKSLRN